MLEQASSSSSLTLAKVMLLQEPTGHSHSYSSGTEKSSTSSLNFGVADEGMTLEDLDGCTLLHLACETADIGMLELLLQYGANVNAIDSRGNMPLHRCIIKGKTSYAKLLLSRWIHLLGVFLVPSLQSAYHCWVSWSWNCRGADAQALNGEGKTPLDIAADSNFSDSEVLALLSDSNGWHICRDNLPKASSHEISNRLKRYSYPFLFRFKSWLLFIWFYVGWVHVEGSLRFWTEWVVGRCACPRRVSYSCKLVPVSS